MFKIGDRVRRIGDNNGSAFLVGDIGTVVRDSDRRNGTTYVKADINRIGNENPWNTNPDYMYNFTNSLELVSTTLQYDPNQMPMEEDDL